MKKHYWQNSFLSKFKSSIETINDLKGEYPVGSLDGLFALFETITEDKIIETILEIPWLNFERLLTYRNKTNASDLIKNNLDENFIKEDMEDCSDNFVAYRSGDELGKLLFKMAVKSGCCRSRDFEVIINGDKWFMHFNYGH